MFNGGIFLSLILKNVNLDSLVFCCAIFLFPLFLVLRAFALKSNNIGS